MITLKYKATQKLLDAIANGTFDFDGRTSVKYYIPVFSCLIDINKDWTVELLVDEDTILNNPDFFEEISENK